MKTRTQLLCALTILVSTIAALAQDVAPTSPSTNSAELHQALLDLTNPWTVMCVAAHPDDEDGTTLTVLRRKHGVHTVSLFSTYGEGGQNAVGSELYEELGVIRALETVKASEIQGSEPHFMGLKDFGFSKTSEETFRVWEHDEALRRMVLKIRELRPDVIITNHDTSRGHGHHQATGQLILEAFEAAADPKRFPEQLTQLKPWQPQRLFVRVFGAGAPAATDKVVAIDPNEVDPVRDATFAEQALTALQQHATQGPWPRTIEELLQTRRIEGGKLPPIRYRLVREAPNAPALPKDAETLLDGLKLPPSFASLPAPPTIEDRPLTDFYEQRDHVLQALIDWRLSNLEVEAPADDFVRFRRMNSRADKALAAAAGVSLTVNTNEPVIRERKTAFAVNLSNAGSKPLQISKLSFVGFGKELAIDAPDHLLADTDTSLGVEVTTPANASSTVPKADHLYDETFLGEPFQANAEIDIEGAKFPVAAQINVDVVPAVEIKSISPSPCVKTEEVLGHCDVLNLDLTNHGDTPFRGSIIITNDAGHLRAPLQLVLGPRESRTEKLRSPALFAVPEALRGMRTSKSLQISIYPQNSKQPITQRSVNVVYSNAHVLPDLRVAYLRSFDQTLQNSLASLGVEAKALTVADVQTADLSVYDTIIIDNRGYEAHPGLVAANSRLLEFVEKGGTLIVFYHKDNEWNPDANKNRPQLAPYPIVLGSERVTDETARVRFLQPRHLLLNSPNRIRQADFSGWIQERGLYYPKEWDKRYTALFAMNDPGEQPLRGGLLVGKSGKGNYIYTSMVWYRQLRAGVPGAYRMFANMISYGKK